MNPEIRPVEPTAEVAGVVEYQERERERARVEVRERAREIQESYKENFIAAIQQRVPDVPRDRLELYFYPELTALTKPFPEDWEEMSENDRQWQMGVRVIDSYQHDVYKLGVDPEGLTGKGVDKFVMERARKEVLGREGWSEAKEAIKVLREAERSLLVGRGEGVMVAYREKVDRWSWDDKNPRIPNRGFSPLLRAALGPAVRQPAFWTGDATTPEGTMTPETRQMIEETAVPGVSIYSADHEGGAGDTPWQMVTLQIEANRPEDGQS